jgi:hypothetical protein
MELDYLRKLWNSQMHNSEKPQPPKPETKTDPQGASLNVPAMGPSPIAVDFAFPVAEKDGSDNPIFSFYFGIAR